MKRSYYKKSSKTAKTGNKSQYYTGRALSNTKGEQQHFRLKELRAKRQKVLSWLGALLALVILILIIVLQLINSPQSLLSFDNQQVKTKRTVAYNQTINDYLSRYPVERLAFLLNHDRLNDFFVSKHPEILSIKLKRLSAWGDDQFALKARQPIAMFEINNQVAFVDNEGVSFDYYEFDKPSLRVLDRTGVNQAKVVSRRLLEFIGQAVSLFNQSGFSVEQVVLPPQTVHQIELKLKDRAYPIRLTVDNDASAQINGVLKVIKKLDREQKTVRYLDGRVPGKVFYKQK